MTALKDITDPKMIAKLEKTAAREAEKEKKKAARAVQRTEKRAQAAQVQAAKKAAKTAEAEKKNAEKKAAKEAKEQEKRQKFAEKVAAARAGDLAKLIRKAGKFAYTGGDRPNMLIDHVIVEASRILATDGKTAIVIQTTLPIAEEIGAYARGEDGEWRRAGAVKDLPGQMPDVDTAIKLTKPRTYCTLNIETVRQVVGFLKAPGSFLAFRRDCTEIVHEHTTLVFKHNPVSHLEHPFALDAVYLLRALDAIEKTESTADIIGEDPLMPFRLTTPTITVVVMPVRA